MNIKKLIIEELNRINEAVSNIVYHRTSLNGIISILKYNKILLSSSLGTSADKISNGMPYFLSFSRTRSRNLGYDKNSIVSIEFDGNALNTKYKGGAIDYWQWGKITAQQRSDTNEYEDRIYSKDPYINNLDKYIVYIDIFLDINDETDKSRKEYINRSINSIKEISSELKNRIRVFSNAKDFQTLSNWKTIDNIDTVEPTEDLFKSRESFEIGMFEKIMTIILIDNPELNDDSYMFNFIKGYVDKFKASSTVDLSYIDDTKIREIVYYVRSHIPYLSTNRDFFNGLNASIHNLVKNTNKLPINYEILKILSDEMKKYNVKTYIDLIKAKKGYKSNNKFIDYSKRYVLVYKRYDVYVLEDDDKSLLSWTILDDSDRNKIMDMGYPVPDKNVINYMFNTYNENYAKETIKKMISSYSEDILIDTKGKLIYTELGEIDSDYSLNNSSAWMYLDKTNWYKFLTENVSEEYIKTNLSKIIKILEDIEMKLSFLYAITSKLLGEEKTKKFFEENEIVPILDYNKKERRYIKNI